MTKPLSSDETAAGLPAGQQASLVNQQEASPSPKQESCDCAAVRLYAGPVTCSGDGQVFINRCVSACQGLTVTSAGWSCAQAAGEAEPSGDTAAQAWVDAGSGFDVGPPLVAA